MHPSVGHHSVIYTIICIKSVCQRSQTAGRNSCSIVSGNVSNWQYILSRVRVSVRPSNFFTGKTLINYHESRPSRIWLLNGPAARPVTIRSATVTVDPSLCRFNCGNSLISRTDWPKTTKTNQSKRRQLEFIHSRLEQCGFGIITSPMRL